MPPLYTLRTLGVPSLLTADGEAVRFRTRKHFALLIRLAVEPGRPLTRDQLIELLWGSAPEAAGRHSLAQAVTILKAKIGRAHLLIHKSTITLAAGVVTTDVAQLENCDGAIAGRFLEAFEIPGARAFEDWRDAWHARLLPRLRDCLVRHMDAARRIGDFATVQLHAEVLADLDPLSEDALRGIMEARAWVGDRTNALKAYAAFATRLEEELGAKPAPELTRIAHLLREGRRSPYRQPSDPPPAAGEKRFEPERVVGREREFSRLYDAWIGARRREPCIMVLTGDPGVGKTTLTNAFASTCQMEGAVVARAQAYDAERELPFAVLAELVRQLTMQRAIGAADPEALSELSRICPDVVAAFPGVPKPVEWSAEITPLRLADAFLKTILSAAEESPLVLVVDDVHAADNASAAILHVVARKLPAVRLVLVLTGRPNELRASGAAQALTSDATVDALELLELDTLSNESARRLVDTLVSNGEQPVPDGVKHRILQASGGNPLALELLVGEWLSRGAASLLGDLDRLNTLPAATLGIPRAIRAIFEKQVTRLDRQTHAVLDLAAILGRRLSELKLYKAVGLHPAEAAEALSILRDGGLLREIHGELEFRNELIRAQAYYAVAAVARAQLHRSVADLLVASIVPGGESLDLEVGWHLLRAGESATAEPFILNGASDAIEAGAPAEAQRILEGFASIRGGVDRLESRARLLLSQALIGQSNARDALPLVSQLLACADLSPDDTAVVAGLAATTEHLLNRDTGHRYRVAADRALASAQKSGDLALVASALFESARAAVEFGDQNRLDEVHRTLVSMFADQRSQETPMAYYARGFCEYFAQKPRAAAASLERAVALLGTSKDLARLSRALTGLGACCMDLCEFSRAGRAFGKALELAERIGDDSRSSIISSNMSLLSVLQGSFQQAVELGLRSLHHARRAVAQPVLAQSYLNLGEAYMMLGERGRASECQEAARVWVADQRNWKVNVEFCCQAAHDELMLGNTQEALAQITTAERLAYGREAAITPPVGFHILVLFRVAHGSGAEVALAKAYEMRSRFRNAHPLLFLDSVAAVAWLETKVRGNPTSDTVEDLKSYQLLGAIGRKLLFVQEGFLTPDLPAIP